MRAVGGDLQHGCGKRGRGGAAVARGPSLWTRPALLGWPGHPSHATQPWYLPPSSPALPPVETASRGSPGPGDVSSPPQMRSLSPAGGAAEHAREWVVDRHMQRPASRQAGALLSKSKVLGPSCMLPGTGWGVTHAGCWQCGCRNAWSGPTLADAAAAGQLGESLVACGSNPVPAICQLQLHKSGTGTGGKKDVLDMCRGKVKRGKEARKPPARMGRHAARQASYDRQRAEGLYWGRTVAAAVVPPLSPPPLRPVPGGRCTEATMSTMAAEATSSCCSIALSRGLWPRLNSRSYLHVERVGARISQHQRNAICKATGCLQGWLRNTERALAE